MYQALVIGNGESRRGINLKNFQPDYTIIGCNALHRNFIADHLICCDRRMAEEATENPDNKDTVIYVRDDWWRYYFKIRKHKNTKTLPDLPYTGERKQDQPLHWGSGCYAVLVAATLGFKDIKLLGFDLYPTLKNKVNNIYKGTDNYSKEDSNGVDYSFWVYQIEKVFRYFPESNFTILNDLDWTMPSIWKSKNNVHFENISTYKD